MDPFYIFFNQYQTNSHEYIVINLTNTYLLFGVVRVQPSYLFSAHDLHLTTYNTILLDFIVNISHIYTQTHHFNSLNCTVVYIYLYNSLSL